MKRTLTFFCLIAATLGSNSALAADLPVPANPPQWSWQQKVQTFDWTGMYGGINGGAAFGTSNQTQTLPPVFTTGNFQVNGGLVGGTIGFNLQVGRTVFGVEGDIDWMRLTGSTPCRGGAFTCTTASNYLVTGRPRLGFAFLNNLFGYVTGGGALGNINQSFRPALAGNSGTISNRVGWTAGGGLEYGLWTNWSSSWSIKAEYLYVNLGSFNCTVACSGVAGQITSIKLRENLVRAGVNYRF